MTTSDFSILSAKSVQLCSMTNDFEVQLNGEVIGYAATELRGYQLANNHVYLLLTHRYLDPADLSQDDADALLSAHLQDPPRMEETLNSVDGLEQSAGVSRPLPESHPVIQLLREAAWLATYIP
jgi:hypothetical protein